MSGDESGISSRLTKLTHRLRRLRPTNIGFPGATDFDHAPLADLLTRHLLNNVGDPYANPDAGNHTRDFEREVIDWFADLFRAPEDDRWGYVTNGGSESNMYALWLARSLHRDGVVYFSRSAHPSVAKAVDVLGMESVVIRTDPFGEIDYQDLAGEVGRRRDRPAIVLASVGTTMSEAVDDVGRILQTLDSMAITRRFVHADAALAGVPLALIENRGDRPAFDLADGADSISISGHKFLGAPTPCSVLITRASLRDRLAAAIVYTGAADTTLFGSRSGHAPLILWHTIQRHGVHGLRKRAEASRALAEYTQRQLEGIGWEAHRNPHGFTVVLRTPPPKISKRWVLVNHEGWSHIVCMPGVTKRQIDRFVTELRAALTPQPAAPARPSAQSTSPVRASGARRTATIPRQRIPTAVSR